MTEIAFKEILNSFLKRFNEMVNTERKDFLIREELVTYEYSQELKRHNVTYRVKKSLGRWTIEATTDHFWLLKRRFPLIKMKRNKGMVTITGLFSKKISEPFPEEELDTKLTEYLEICKNIPTDAFVKS